MKLDYAFSLRSTNSHNFVKSLNQMSSSNIVALQAMWSQLWEDNGAVLPSLGTQWPLGSQASCLVGVSMVYCRYPAAGSVCEAEGSGGGWVQLLFHSMCKLSESPSCSWRAWLLPFPLCSTICSCRHCPVIHDGALRKHLWILATPSSYGPDSYEAQVILHHGLLRGKEALAGHPVRTLLPHPCCRAGGMVQLNSFSVLYVFLVIRHVGREWGVTREDSLSSD